MKSNPLVLAVLGSLIAIIIIDIWKVVGMSLSKALYGFLITINPLDALELFFFSLFIFFLILLVKQRGGILKSKLEEKSKQYDELIKRIKLPEKFDKAITIEVSPKWNRPHRQQIISATHNKPPQLYFDLRAINRTYHSFEAEEAVAKCFCDREEVCKGTWDRKTRVSETFDMVEDLPKFCEGDIVFHVPIKELYNNLEKWELEGTVKYRSKEPLIGEDNQYANPEIDIHLEYMLSEKLILELKKEVEKVLGDER